MFEAFGQLYMHTYVEYFKFCCETLRNQTSFDRQEDKYAISCNDKGMVTQGELRLIHT